MDVRQSIHSDHAKTLDTAGLRREFLIETIFVADEYHAPLPARYRRKISGMW